tara:strand:+ start:605 stop:1795 length:1191 start_codon:yes stop_codon:yes gene_type:complete
MILKNNIHMEHLEDSIINNGVQGAKDSIKFLTDLASMLSGYGKQPVNTTVKWDGAPAVIVGRKEGKLFVATKSYFSKNSKYYQSVDEINNADIPEDLKYKLNACLYYLKDLKTDVVLQGDLLFTHKDLRTEVIEGENMVVFHPNTIVYAVPRKSELGKTICKSTLGIVWHTVYSDDGASYDFNIDMINQIKDVFMIDANYNDVSGTATFTKDETQEVSAILAQADKVFRLLNTRILNGIAMDKHVKEMIKIHYNLMIRDGKVVPNSGRHVTSLQKFLKLRAQSELDKLKTEKGKDRKEIALGTVLFMASAPAYKLRPIFEFQRLIVQAKLMIIAKLNEAAKLKTFLKTSNGYKLTGEEGYVAVSNGNAVKLVDRLEFSYANFSDDIIKGWTNDTRT